MGRKNKYFKKNLKEQAYDRLVSMQCFGESKRAAKEAGETDNKIFSFSTYKSYRKHIKYFLNWLKEVHPECTTLSEARKYSKEWLELRSNQTDKEGKQLSAWTIQLESAALNKLFGIKSEDDDFFHAPKRKREDIKRSRVSVSRDKHFSLTNNDELIKFARGTGLRRAGLCSIKGKDLFTREKITKEIQRLIFISEDKLSDADRQWLAVLKDTSHFPEQQYFIRVTEKGGRMRLAPVIGPDTEAIVQRFQRTAPSGKVWEHVHSAADIHSYRADYAQTVYKQFARPIEDIPFDKVSKNGKHYQSEVYVCRKDEAGRKLDRVAMLKASKALGHNRIDVVANNYLRGL